MGKPVAKKGDVVAIPGTTPFTGADSGTWTAGAVIYQPHSKLTYEGTLTLYQATCDFSFEGLTSSKPPAPISGSETVTLTAVTTALTESGKGVLLHGDNQSGTYGNKLVVNSSANIKLKSD